MVAASAQSSTVEPVFQLLAVLGFPGLDGQAVLLLDLVAVPLWNHVEGAEGYDAEVRSLVVAVAALQTFLVLVGFLGLSVEECLAFIDKIHQLLRLDTDVGGNLPEQRPVDFFT